jgi:hypothetical protein
MCDQKTFSALPCPALHASAMAARVPTLTVLSRDAEANVLVSLGLNTTCTQHSTSRQTTAQRAGPNRF